MNRWAQRGLLWIAPAIVVAVYAALWLTNGALTHLFQPTAWGSFLYANVWDHLLHGNLLIDPQYAWGEYFITGPERFVTYFGVMPALLRGIAGLFAPDIYTYGLTNLSMIVAMLLGLGSVWYAVQRLAKGQRSALIIGISLIVAILIASPVGYLLTWSWTYHEIIIWGVAWALVFVSLYSLWLFDRQRFTVWHGLWLGIAVGMAVLCRPTMGLMLIVPYGFLCVQALWQLRHKHHRPFRSLLPGAIACLMLALVVMAVNQARWGSPLTFVKITQNVQFVELYPERRAHIEQAGEFNIGRLPTSLFYYLVPTGDTITTKPPFITIDRELTHFNRAPHYDYIEGSRVPVPLSMTYILLLGVMGIIALRRFSKADKIASGWLLAGAGLTCLALLTVYAVALRYTAEFVPAAAFLSLIYVAGIAQKKVSAPSRKLIITLVVTGVVSTYITIVTTLAYKEFVWDVPAPIRQSIRTFLHYSPAPYETKHIIDGKRFPIY